MINAEAAIGLPGYKITGIEERDGRLRIAAEYIDELFHTKIEVLQRQAYGFRNFNNYRL